MRFKLGLCYALVFLTIKSGENTSNVSSDIEWKPSFNATALNDLCEIKNSHGHPVQNRSSSCLRASTKFGKDTSHISLDIAVTINDLCDLENKGKVTPFELGLCLSLVLLGTYIS